MAKQNLLLVDADLRSLRVLEVSLRKAGYNVASIGNGREALGMLEQSRPDLVLCDTRLPGMDGFELIQELRKRPELADIPLMILSSDVSVETKVRGLQLGVEDYLTKPIYIKELLARVSIVLQRKRREGIEQLEHGNKRRFSGSLSDMGVVDLLQAVDHNKKSGVLYLQSGSADGAIYFRNGAPVDATVGPLTGSRAIYRALLWTDGTFEIDFREVDREDQVQNGMQGLLMEGLRRVDEWGRLLEQLPDMDTVFEVSETQLFSRLGEIPDQINSVLREVDGERSLWQILDACDGDDLETLNALSKLYFEGLLYNTGRQAHKAQARPYEQELEQEPSEIVLPHISSGPPGVITHTLAPAWPSVPSGDQTWTKVDDDTFQINIPSAPRLPDEPLTSLSQSPKRRKGRKRKRRGPSQSLKSEPEAQEVDENVAEITPSTIAPPPEVAEAARAASVPPPLPPTSRPAKPQSWPPEPITSEVSLAELTEAETPREPNAEVLSDESVSREITVAPAPLTATPPPLPAASLAPAHATPPPLPSLAPRVSIPDAADITLLPGAPDAPAETARPVGPATLPPLSAASSAPPGPTTLRPESTLGWTEPTTELPLSSDDETTSGPVLDAEAAADLSLAETTDMAAVPSLATNTEQPAALTKPPLDAEAVDDLTLSESRAPQAAAASTRPVSSIVPPVATKTARPDESTLGELDAAAPPPLPISNSARSLPPPPASELDGEIAASMLASSTDAELLRSIPPANDTSGEEATLLAASRASIAPAPESNAVRVSMPPNASLPPDFDAAAAKLAGSKIAGTPSLRYPSSQPHTTAKPPPFSAVPGMSQTPSARAEHSPQHRTDVPPPFLSALPANDNAGAPVSDLSEFAKVALALNSTAPEAAVANDNATPPQAEEPKPESAAPPVAASEPVPDVLSVMPTEEIAAVAAPPSLGPKPESQGIWSDPSKAPSTAAPAPKRRSTRFLQVGSVAAAAALAAGLYGLRARDVAHQSQGSLIRAVPTEQVAEKRVEPTPEPAPAAEAARAPAPEEVDEPEPAAAEPANAQAANAKPATPESEPAPQPAAAEPAKAQTAEAPKPATPATPATAEQAMAEGRSLEQKGKKKDALALYEKTVAEGGGSSQLQSHMAFMYLNQGNNALAEAHALKASAADETNSEAWIVLGAARSGLGKKALADEAYRACATKGVGQYVTECRRMLR